MKVLRRLQPWQTTLLPHSLPIRTVPFRRVAIIPGAKGETGIEGVEAEAEVEGGGRIGGEERASDLRTRGNVTRSAIWAEANICT